MTDTEPGSGGCGSMRRFSVAARRNRPVRRHFLSGAGSLSLVTAGLIALHATDPVTAVEVGLRA